MSKDPAVLFYTSDFIVGTMTMDYEQKGKYIQLLCLQHQNGHLSEKQMLLVCGSYDEDIFSKFEKDEEGKYYNERMEEESIKRRKFTESRRNNRSKVDNNNTCVYLIFDPISKNTKIGSSNNPERRLVELKNQNKNELLYIIAFASGVPQTLEKEIHDMYESKNVVNEWYSLTEKEISQIISSNHMIVTSQNHMISHMENENINENINDIKDIIDYLNIALGTKYRYTTKSIQTHIRARLREGFTVDDFKCVIDKKKRSWMGTDFQKFLRPDTLFGGKFQSYLNEIEKESSFDADDFWNAAIERQWGK